VRLELSAQYAPAVVDEIMQELQREMLKVRAKQ
jgi:hypothetical protein